MTKNITNKISDSEPNKKPFLFSDRGKILPNNLKKGGKINNEFDKTEVISSVNKVGDYTYLKTTENIGDDSYIKRTYSLQGNNMDLKNMSYGYLKS